MVVSECGRQALAWLRMNDQKKSMYESSRQVSIPINGIRMIEAYLQLFFDLLIALRKVK